MTSDKKLIIYYKTERLKNDLDLEAKYDLDLKANISDRS